MEISGQKQTKLHDPEKGIRGNCMVACYANYLNIPIENCPAFEELFSCTKPNGFWWDCVLLWWERMGYSYQYCTDKKDLPEIVFNGLYFVSGISPRNSEINHLVIYKKGELFFDPHPDGTGIVKGTERSFEYPLPQPINQ